MKKIALFIGCLLAFAACKNNTSQSATTDVATSPIQKVITASAIKNLEVYPLSVDGMERHVIMLDSLGSDVEYGYQVEIIPGKTMDVDCNNYGLMGEISEKIVDGFGYNYYEFASTGNVFSTQMACPDDTKTSKFVTSASRMVRYNSLLPIVVFAPKGIDIKYKIWTAGQEQNAEKK